MCGISLVLAPSAFFVDGQNDENSIHRKIQTFNTFTITSKHLLSACFGMIFAKSFYECNLEIQYIISVAIIFIIFFFINKSKVLKEDAIKIQFTTVDKDGN